MKIEMNLFWATRRLTQSREDHLTEFFASALNISPIFRERYSELTLSRFAGTVPCIESISTQVRFEGTTCCPDMILRLSDGKTIACEHKLDAFETLGPQQDERTQLDRYLDLPVDGLIYVRGSWKPPSSEVLQHPKYVHPPQGEHFLWRDFYPLFTDENVVMDWLRDGFERLGFTPPHPSVGEMSGPDDQENRRNRKNFAKLWGKTRSFAHRLGWSVNPGAIVELYLSQNPSSRAESLFISPTKFDRFLVRVTPRKASDHLLQRLQQATDSLMPRTEITEREVKRKGGKERVIDITSSLREILGNRTLTADEIEDRLLEFAEPILLSIQK
jgi:hypothetical protein